MRYPPSLLDEIRQRLPVSVVVGRRVKLTRAGREWKGLSPFNQEKTPSFFVNDQKGSFFDFSSGRNGDIFKFVMETEGVSFPEAVERLANEAGVPLPKLDAEAGRIEEQRKGLGEAMELAAQYFERQLEEMAGRTAREYLKGRDLPRDVQKSFRIGYAPADRHGLRDHLAGKGVSVETMVEAGLLVAGNDIPVPYDRFRDRIIFPIADARGRVIAFGGRAMQKDAQAKYLNSPETPLFHKGATLYNIDKARRAAHDKGQLIAVEGYIDVIAMTRAGMAETVAPLGTALTEEQLAMMWRMTDEPILCFDGDKAGIKAAWRAIDVALPHLEAGRSLRFAFLPGGQDPDEMLRAAGPDALADVIRSPRVFVDVLFQREVDREPIDTPERRADLEKRLRECIGQIKDESVRRHYRDAIGERLGALFQPQRQRQAGGRGAPQPGGPRRTGRFAPAPPTPKSPVLVSSRLAQTALFRGGAALHPREVALVLAAINHPVIVNEEAEVLAGLELGHRALVALRAGLLDCAGNGAAPDGAAVRQALAARGLAGDIALAEAHLSAGNGWVSAESGEADVLGCWRDAATLHIRETTLPKEMREIGEKVARDSDEQALGELNGLVQRREVL